jgi:glycerol-3-phosphate dehydrogenase
MFSILGGKLTTYRLMAEKMVDVVMSNFGLKIACRTAELPRKARTS